MQLSHVTVAVIVGALLLLVLLMARAKQRRNKIRQELLPALHATGLHLSGDPIGPYQLQGTYGGIEMRLENHVSIRPPWATNNDASRTHARITFWAPVPYSLVCPKSVSDVVVVQFPPTGRLRTGNWHFDAAFDVFIDPYRRAAGQKAGPNWPPGNVLGAMMDLQLSWLRVKDDAAELVLEPIEHTRDTSRALMLAQSLALIARGNTLAWQVPRGALSAPSANATLSPVFTLGIAFAGALLIAAPIGSMTLCFLPVVKLAIETDVCGAGQRLLLSVADYSDGTTGYGMYCSGNPLGSLALLHIICAALAAALVLAPAMLLAVWLELRASLAAPKH